MRRMRTMNTHRVKGMQLGAFDYIMKPVPINELLDTITQAYNKKQGLA